MKMENKITGGIEEELRLLSLLTDDEIDTSDISETSDWSGSKRSRFYADRLERRNYDVRAIANWFIEKLNDIDVKVTNLSLNKIVYFAIERFIVERHVLLTEARVEAWDYGPVVREIYNPLKNAGAQNIAFPIKKFSLEERKMIIAYDEFVQSDTELLETLCLTYGIASPSRLVDCSHVKGGAWHKVWSESRAKNPGMVITPEIILDYAPAERQING